jgi:DNA topoisomerase-1
VPSLAWPLFPSPTLFRSYWGVQAKFPTEPGFTANLVRLGQARVATGKDFDSRGVLERADVVALDEAGANALVEAARPAPFAVTTVDEKPYRSSPKPPFITSTLQQEGGRKLSMTAREVMRTAQGLYERGYITYMRTDSTTLSEEAIAAARRQVAQLYGDSYLPPAPRTYSKKVKNAQEAHEAIRPAGDSWRTPDQLGGELRGADLRLYELIWKRTLASQMADARGMTVSVRIEAPVAVAPLQGTALAGAPAVGVDGSGTVTTEWSASGRTITFPGYLRVYVEGSDDPEADLDDRERVLPTLAEGDRLPGPGLDAAGHATQPPARYTEASLVRRLEELGIGRPSTYASIMQTIQDRGYVWRKGQALVPSWTAFAVINLLEGHFSAEVAYSFTAQMEDELDQIAVGARERSPFLRAFWFGEEPGTVGLSKLIELALENADPAAVNAIPLGKDAEGNEVVVRNGKYGPYVKRGDDTASVPQDLAPDELDVDKALELLAAPKGDTPIGESPDGLPVYVKTGRFGPYVQLGDADTLPPDEKPKMASIFKTMSPSSVTVEDALRLLSLPRVVGEDPESGEPIEALNGRYGPYLRKAKETRNLATEEDIFTVDLDTALALFAQPKLRGRAAAAPPLRELGADPVSGKPMVIKSGRYGPYVTDGETNASLRERDGDTVEELTDERAAELLQARREAGPKKKAGARKAPAKKATAKKAAVKKAAGAKKAAPKKVAAKKTAAAKKAAAKKASS